MSPGKQVAYGHLYSDWLYIPATAFYLAIVTSAIKTHLSVVLYGCRLTECTNNKPSAAIRAYLGLTTNQ